MQADRQTYTCIKISYTCYLLDKMQEANNGQKLANLSSPGQLHDHCMCISKPSRSQFWWQEVFNFYSRSIYCTYTVHHPSFTEHATDTSVTDLLYT